MDAYYPPTGFYFKLSFTGISSANDAGFQEVSGLEAEMAVEEITSGGENRFKYKLPTGTKYGNLVLKRGLMLNNSQLTQWCFTTIGSDLSQTIVPRTVTLTLMNPDAQPLMAWSFVRAWPVKWSVSDFNSMDGKIVVESIEFAYNYFNVAS